MKPFGAFLMRSRRNAGILAFAFALLPILNWLSIIITLLVTLRKGAQEGVWILSCTLLPLCVLAFTVGRLAVIYNMLIPILVVWGLALVLRSTHNWASVLLIGAGVGVIAIVVLHSYIANIDAWWQHKMLSYLQQLSVGINVDTMQQKQTILHLSKIATGLQIAVLLLMNLLWLLLARCWQAILYNPGALRGELQAIRIPRWVSVVLLLVLVMVLLIKQPLLIDLLPVLLLPFMLAGLSLFHFIIAVRKMHWLWLFVFYIALLFAFPYIGMALVLLALVDSGLNLRQRYRARS